MNILVFCWVLRDCKRAVTSSHHKSSNNSLSSQLRVLQILTEPSNIMHIDRGNSKLVCYISNAFIVYFCLFRFTNYLNDSLLNNPKVRRLARKINTSCLSLYLEF